MKNILLITFINSALFANAQLGNKGQRIASAIASVNKTKVTGNNYSINQFNASSSLAIGKFVTENAIHQIGFSGFINHHKAQYFNLQKSTDRGLTLFYNSTSLHNIHKNWNWALTKQMLINNTKSSHFFTNTNDSVISKSYGIGFFIVPSIYYKLSKKIALSASLNNVLGVNLSYGESNNLFNNSKEKTTNANLQAGFWNAPLQNIGIGINYIW